MKTKTPHKNQSTLGMTIVEIMVVLTIIAGMMGLAVISIGALGGNDLKNGAFRVTAIMKYTYANAAINNTQYRMVLNLDTGEYHTEIIKSALTTNSGGSARSANGEDLLTEEAKRLAEKEEAKTDLFDEEEENPFGINRKVTYERVEDVVVKPEKLKDGIKFLKVATSATQEPVETGIVVINFYPNGFQDQAYIVIADEDGNAITLMSKPLSGRVKTYVDEKELPEDFFEVENDD